MIIQTRKQGESQMRISLIAAAAAFGFVVHAAYAQPVAQPAPIAPSSVAQTSYRTVSIDHSRKAEPVDYSA